MENEYYEVDQMIERMKVLRKNSGKEFLEYMNQYKKELVIRFVHEATALEGNTLTLEETQGVLEGKEPGEDDSRERKREIQEARNCYKAYLYMRRSIRRGQALNEKTIRILHEIVTERIQHGGIYRSAPVWVPDSEMEFPPHYDLKNLMKNFTDRLMERVMVCRLPEAFHPIDLGAWACMELIRIHPFLEGNERVAMLMLNYLLIEHGLLPVSIPKNKRQEYEKIMNRYRWEREIVPFACLVEELESEELLNLERGARQAV